MADRLLLRHAFLLAPEVCGTAQPWYSATYQDQAAGAMGRDVQHSAPNGGLGLCSDRIHPTPELPSNTICFFLYDGAPLTSATIIDVVFLKTFIPRDTH